MTEQEAEGWAVRLKYIWRPISAVKIYGWNSRKIRFHLRMLFFRRNCWLSGLPIEASAHEKAEWIRGFNRKEVEAWNLQF